MYCISALGRKKKQTVVQATIRFSPRAKVEKDASIKSFVAIVCQHLFEGCNDCT